MLRLSKKADYALMAMKHLAIKTESAAASRPSTSAREIAEQYDIPIELMAKVACSTEDEQCEQFTKCNVRDPLWRIKDRILVALSTCSLAEITTEAPYEAPAAIPVSLTRSSR